MKLKIPKDILGKEIEVEIRELDAVEGWKLRQQASQKGSFDSALFLKLLTEKACGIKIEEVSMKTWEALSALAFKKNCLSPEEEQNLLKRLF